MRLKASHDTIYRSMYCSVSNSVYFERKVYCLTMIVVFEAFLLIDDKSFRFKVI